MSPTKSRSTKSIKRAASKSRRAAAPLVDTSSKSLDARADEVKRSVGRPIDPNLPRAKVWLRIDDEELASWNAAAAAAGHTISSWARHVCNVAAKASAGE
jgi:hypothetical protein